LVGGRKPPVLFPRKSWFVPGEKGVLDASLPTTRSMFPSPSMSPAASALVSREMPSSEKRESSTKRPCPSPKSKAFLAGLPFPTPELPNTILSFRTEGEEEKATEVRAKKSMAEDQLGGAWHLIGHAMAAGFLYNNCGGCRICDPRRHPRLTLRPPRCSLAARSPLVPDSLPTS